MVTLTVILSYIKWEREGYELEVLIWTWLSRCQRPRVPHTHSYSLMRGRGGGRAVSLLTFLDFNDCNSVCVLCPERGTNKVTDKTEGRNRRCFQHLAHYLHSLCKHLNIIISAFHNIRILSIFMISNSTLYSYKIYIYPSFLTWLFIFTRISDNMDVRLLYFGKKGLVSPLLSFREMNWPWKKTLTLSLIFPQIKIFFFF